MRWDECYIFQPPAVQGGQGRLVGPYPLWDSVSGSPVRWGVWSIPSPTIFGSGAVRCGPVRCFVGPVSSAKTVNMIQQQIA